MTGAVHSLLWATLSTWTGISLKAIPRLKLQDLMTMSKNLVREHLMALVEEYLSLLTLWNHRKSL